MTRSRAKPGRVKRHAFFCHQLLLVRPGDLSTFPRLVGLIRALPSAQVCICQPRRACVHQSFARAFQHHTHQKAELNQLDLAAVPSRSTPSLAGNAGTFLMDVSLSNACPPSSWSKACSVSAVEPGVWHSSQPLCFMVCGGGPSALICSAMLRSLSRRSTHILSPTQGRCPIWRF
jgi:hypothetical protein